MRGKPESGARDVGALPNKRLQATANSLRFVPRYGYRRRLKRGVR